MNDYLLTDELRAMGWSYEIDLPRGAIVFSRHGSVVFELTAAQLVEPVRQAIRDRAKEESRDDETR